MSDKASTFIRVKVLPSASRNEIVGWVDGGDEPVLKIKIKAAPDKGKANKKLIRFLAKTIKISQNNIQLVSGITSRLKGLEIIDFKLSQGDIFW